MGRLKEKDPQKAADTVVVNYGASEPIHLPALTEHLGKEGAIKRMKEKARQAEQTRKENFILAKWRKEQESEKPVETRKADLCRGDSACAWPVVRKGHCAQHQWCAEEMPEISDWDRMRAEGL